MLILRSLLLLSLMITVLGCEKPTFTPYESYPMGLAKALEENKPIFIHFTCFGCVGNNEFYNDLIVDQAVEEKLINDYITIELYTDDRSGIPKSELDWAAQQHYPDSIKQRLLAVKNIGKFYTLFEQFKFQRTTQPLYVILNTKEEILIKPFGYQRKNAKRFLQKLATGTTEFHSK